MSFTQIRYLPETSVVRYRSGLVNYEETLVDGRWLVRYWNATGFVEKESLAQADTKETLTLTAKQLTEEGLPIEIPTKRDCRLFFYHNINSPKQYN